MRTAGRFFDGESGLRLDVQLEVSANSGAIVLLHPDLPGGQQNWPVQDVRRLHDEAREDQITLTLRADDSHDSALIETGRLVVWEPAGVAAILAACPNLKKRDLAKGTGKKIVTRVTLAVGALALMIFVILPAMSDTMAKLIPIEREVRWGKTVVAQMERFFGGREIGALVCDDPDGLAALDEMVARLTGPADMTYDLNVQVFDHKMVNAFAAPGGQIVMMRGLIEKASTPEEVAAVLAHEIAHVENRDATRNSLRAAGSAGLLSMVFGDFSGGSLAVIMAEMTLNSSYTREAEAAADDFAHQMLDRANVSAEGMAVFFDKLAGIKGRIDLPEYLSSHPQTESRADLAREFASEQSETTPVLSDSAWADLKGVCG